MQELKFRARLTKSSRSPDRPYLLAHAPDRMIRPAGQLGACPFCVLVFVTGIAGIRNLLSLGLSRGDEMKGVSGDERPARQFRQYLGHMTGNALAAGTVRRMMGVLFQAGGMRAVLATDAVAG